MQNGQYWADVPGSAVYLKSYFPYGNETLIVKEAPCVLGFM